GFMVTCRKYVNLGKYLIACLLFIATALLFISQAASVEVISLVAGNSKMIKVGFPVTRLATGDVDICSVVKSKTGEFLLNGKSAGTTNIIIWGKNGRKREFAVRVLRANTNANMGDLKKLLADIEGVQVKIFGQQIIVEGEVFSHKSLERINRILTGMPEVVNLVQMSPIMKKMIAEEICKAVAIEGIKVKTVRNQFILEGSVLSEADIKRAEKIALAYTPNIINALAVRASGNAHYQPRLIEISLNVMELEKKIMKDVGVHWNPSIGLGGGGAYSGSKGGGSPGLMGSLVGTISNLFPKMRKVQEDGNGRSLIQQALVTKEGEKADFFAGTEIPIQVAQEGGIMSLEYKEIGVTFKIQPFIDSTGNIDTIINIESSSITGEGAGGAPIIKSAKLSTSINVKNGVSIALGGLIGQHELHLISSDPTVGGGGNATFQANKGTRKSRDSTEAIIFVTPKILTRSTDAVRELGQKVEKSFTDLERRNLEEKK
ncbi:MAG: pilus assembly protein N-terminal domain-containing protein, partial [Pseudomonadota bacterium]|nr:pilus assembly protein N-terminal domain-containing protein [Pseudomonadota bacterium]